MEGSSSGFEKLLVLVFVLVGLGFVGRGLIDIYRGYRSHSWASTSGVIVRSGVEWRTGEREDFTPTVAYRYKVGNVEYESDKIGFGSRTTGRHHEAKAWVDRYQVGTTVPVFYDPTNPAEAVLERGVVRGWGPLVLGSIFVAVGIFFRAMLLRASSPR